MRIRKLEKTIKIVCAAITIHCPISIAGPPAPGTTPIYVDLAMHDGEISIERNHEQQTKEALAHWLTEAHRLFGGSDAVYIRFPANVPLDKALDIQALVERTHRDTHLVLLVSSREKILEKEIVFSDITVPNEPKPPTPSKWPTGDIFTPLESSRFKTNEPQ